MTPSRPLATAFAGTALVAALALALTGGHSPFRVIAAGADPVAAAVEASADGPAPESPADSQSPEDTAAADGATASPDADPTAGQTADRGTGGSAGSRSGSGGRTPSPTSKPHTGPTTPPTPGSTPNPTANPTPDPTPAPTPKPNPPAASLTVTSEDGQPRLSWSACTSSRFAAYAVVRSADSEIHFPAETNDTLVALITNAGVTSFVDKGATTGARAYYRVWCSYLADKEYKSIWTTPVVSVIP